MSQQNYFNGNKNYARLMLYKNVTAPDTLFAFHYNSFEMV